MAAVLAARVALALMGFQRLRARIEQRYEALPAREDREAAQTLRRAMDRAARALPKVTCLPRALAAEWLLRRNGQAALLSVGVARSDGAARDAALDAHAWVESAGVIVCGDLPDLARYQPLRVTPDASTVR